MKKKTKKKYHNIEIRLPHEIIAIYKKTSKAVGISLSKGILFTTFLKIYTEDAIRGREQAVRLSGGSARSK